MSDPTTAVRLRDGAEPVGFTSAGPYSFDFALGAGPWEVPTETWVRIETNVRESIEVVPADLTETKPRVRKPVPSTPTE